MFPDGATAARLGDEYSVVPVYARMLADTETPVSVWLKLFCSAPYSFVLESVDGEESVSRYSFIGGNPFMVFRSRGGAWEISGARTESGTGDPVGRLRKVFSSFRSATVEGLPRFTGGGVGYCSWDSIRLWESIPDSMAESTEFDDLFFGLYRDIVVFDNRKHQLLVVSNVIEGEYASFEEGYRQARRRIASLMEQMQNRCGVQAPLVRQCGDVRADMDRGAYERAVERCKEYIRAGDIFQVVLSQRFRVGVEGDPFSLYRILRAINPSPYMFYLSLGERAVAGASPEMLVRVEGGEVQTRPIAGTRHRGETAAQDEALAAELLADEKERAEHVMLVDLGRNDVGRVCVPGTVRVEEMMHIERFSHVMHLVSHVQGTLAPNRDCFDALGSCFPAGTLSGAPKIRAMEIIDELETARRGVYGGALGYIDFSGNMDTCIVIRTITVEKGVASIQVGAGIVADSVPGREYEETVYKAGALFQALADAAQIVGRQGDGA